MKRMLIRLCVSLVLSAIVIVPAYSSEADNGPRFPVKRGALQKINKHFSTQAITYSDGAVLVRHVITGPPKPPPGHEVRAQVSPKPTAETLTNALAVPALRWVFGCSAVSGAMVAGYYDRNGFPDIYTGPANNGLFPLDDLSWPSWTDAVGDSYPGDPLIASRYGLDERTVLGSIDDYWVSYLSGSDDPYSGRWTQHGWGDAIGDYMKTSQSAYENDDGATSFYSLQSAGPLNCSAMEGYGIESRDGTYGRKLFYEARGYTVSDCYSQKTDNVVAGGFSFAQYKAEIDAGRPVLLNLQGHSVVGVGYEDATSTVFIHDTWDNSTHSMTWGGSYAGMGLWGASVVNLQASGNATVTVSVSPSNGGTVSGDGISCPGDCSETYGTGTSLVLTAQPAAGFSFGSWSGCDTVSGSQCTVKVEANRNIAAAFLPVVLPPDLSGAWSNVSRTGPRRGFYTISGTFTVMNTGSTNAGGFSVSFYLSSDNAVDAGDIPIVTTRIKSLAAGSGKASTIRYSTTVSPGGKYLIAVIDPSRSISESNEGNNTVAAPIP